MSNMPKKIVATEQRAPDDEQPIALAVAEGLGTLPDVDRREEESVVVRRADLLDGGHELVIPQPRDLSKAQHRIPNPDGTVSYFTESGDLL